MSVHLESMKVSIHFFKIKLLSFHENKIEYNRIYELLIHRRKNSLAIEIQIECTTNRVKLEVMNNGNIFFFPWNRNSTLGNKMQCSRILTEHNKCIDSFIRTLENHRKQQNTSTRSITTSQYGIGQNNCGMKSCKGACYTLNIS